MFLAVEELLSKVGMKVFHEGVIELLEGHGCRVDSDRRVYIEQHLLKQALKTAPSVVQVYGREGQLAMELGERNVYFGTGSDLLHTYDLETGERRDSVLADVGRAARICDALPNMDFLMSSAHPTDVPPHHSYVLAFKEMVENSTKPLVLTAENAKDLKVMIDVSAEIRGGSDGLRAVSYTHLRAHETKANLVCRLLLEKKKKRKKKHKKQTNTQKKTKTQKKTTTTT